MAIIIEEENKINVVKIITWFIIIAVILAAVYYIFFTRPQIVEIVAPANFKNIDPLANVNFNPEDIVNGKDFQSLKSYVSPLAPGNFGRSNPFLPL